MRPLAEVVAIMAVQAQQQCYGTMKNAVPDTARDEPDSRR